MRLIDADTAEKKLVELVELYEKRMPKWSPNDMLTSGRDIALKHGYKADGVEKALETIKDMPTIDVEPAIMSYIKELKMENARLEKLYQKAKQLLKAAVEDIHELLCDKKNLDGNEQSCNICSYIDWCPCCKECTIREDLRNWRYADEVLKLQWSKENPLIIKGGKEEVTLVDYEPPKSFV